MRRDWFLLVCLFLLVTKHVTADESSRDCRNKKEVDVNQGDELRVVSAVDPLTRCYTVSKDKDSGGQCCFHIDGHNEDCERSNKYEPRNNTKCPEYVLTVDSIETRTCNLTIKGFIEAAAIQFESYDADHVPIKICAVTVISRQGGGVTIGAVIGFIFALMGALALAAVLYWRYKGYTQTTTTEAEISEMEAALSPELPPNMKEALKKALKKGIIKKIESSDNREVKVMLLDGSWKEVKTPADVEALSKIR